MILNKTHLFLQGNIFDQCSNQIKVNFVIVHRFQCINCTF